MLRAAIARMNRARKAKDRIAFALFPTPQLDYFRRCAEDPQCKPHLAEIARALGESPEASSPGGAAVPAASLTGGRIFTRFMLTGFATYRALEQLGIQTFESYPYLAFALWKKAGEPLPPKSSRRAALDIRRGIVSRVARKSDVNIPPISTLDQGDAAILALTIAAPAAAALIVNGGTEGRFLLAMPGIDFPQLDIAPS
jgi:hypothetical protein